jgi:hypothetical protein
MVMAQKAYQISRQTGIPIINNKVMIEIMEYNKIDCVVIHELVELLQQKVKSNASDSITQKSKRRKIR